MLQSTYFVKTRLDKSSTVVVEVASFVGYPVYILYIVQYNKITVQYPSLKLL